METKICKKCKQELTLNNFSRVGVGNDKKREVCKPCCNKADVIRNKMKAEKEGKKIRCKRVNVSKEQKHKEMLEASARYRKNNEGKRRQVARDWARKNREYQKKYYVDRYKNNIEFSLTIKIRSRIHTAIRNSHKNANKKNRTIELLGCSYTELKIYIEKMFTDGMSWDLVMNGKVHLDHIKPCKLFDLTKEEEQKKCFNYKNLQPLWAIDNLKKGISYG